MGKSSNGLNEMFRLVEMCKNDSTSNHSFLRRVVLAPEPMCVLASDYQLQDMKRFLTDPANPGVMGVDTTFNLGPYLATVVTYKHLLLDDRRNGKSPVMLGPVLMHMKRSVESYSYLGQVLTTTAPELAGVQWIVTRRRQYVTD